MVVALQRVDEGVNMCGSDRSFTQIQPSVGVDDAALELIERSAPDFSTLLCAIELGVPEQETASITTVAQEVEHAVKDVRLRYGDRHR